MQIDVEQVAKLARLGLTEEEKKLFEQQLSSILDYANILQKLDTRDIPPTSHVFPMKNIFRQDQVIPFESTEEILSNAPEKEEHMFKVPRIIE